MPSPRPVPVSGRVANELRKAIRDGVYTPGDKLPSERVLLEFYGVARNTVREAMRILAEEGLVAAKHGVGVFVRTPQDPPKITLRAATYDYAFNVPLTAAQISDLSDGKTLFLEFGPDTEMQLGAGEPQNLNIAVILRPQ